MKKLTCLCYLIFLLFAYTGAIAQKAKQTKPKAPAQQMPDLQNLIKDLPAEQQAMVKGMFNKTAAHPATEKATAVKYTSPIIPIYLKQPLQVPTEAEAKDKLLWYKGKKLNDSMLVTTRGMVVQYSRKRSIVIAQPLEKSDPFRKMADNLSKGSQMTDDFINKIAARKNSFLDYPLIQMAVDDFQVIDEQLTSVVKNTIELPPLPPNLNRPGADKARGGSMGFDEPTLEDDLEAMHNELKELLFNEPDMNFEPPPAKNFSLAFLCSGNAQKRYQEERKRWEEKFLEYEDNLMRAAMRIIQFMQVTGTISVSRTEAGARSINEDLQEAVSRSLSRRDKKIQLLISSNGKNIFMQDCVISRALRNERQKELMGFGNDKANAFNVLQLLGDPEFENYMNEEASKKNWDVILNMATTLGRNRQTQLLGIEGGVSDRLNQLFEKIMNMNRFALTVDLDFNVHYIDSDDEPSLKASGNIQTSGKAYVRLVRNKQGCKWTLEQSEVEYGNTKEAEYIPMRVNGGTKLVKNEKREWEEYSYNGPKDMLMPMPVFRISFTDLIHQDSVSLEPMQYLPNEYQNPSLSPSAYKKDLLGYVSHVFTSKAKTEMNESQIMDLAKEMMRKFSESPMMPSSLTALGMLKDKFLMRQKKQEAENKTAYAGLTGKAVMLFNALNNSSILVDNSIDTKHKDEGVEVTKGLIKIKVVNEPIQD